LTEAEQKLVSLMYSDRDTVQMYLYNFEGDKYVGRQTYVPNTPYGTEQKEVVSVGKFHLTKDTPAEIEKKSVEEDKPVEEVKGKTEPVKKVQRKAKKK